MKMCVCMFVHVCACVCIHVCLCANRGRGERGRHPQNADPNRAGQTAAHTVSLAACGNVKHNDVLWSCGESSLPGISHM